MLLAGGLMLEESEIEFWASTDPRRANSEHKTKKGGGRDIFREERRPRAMARASSAIIYPRVRSIFTPRIDKIRCLLLPSAAVVLQFNVNARPLSLAISCGGLGSGDWMESIKRSCQLSPFKWEAPDHDGGELPSHLQEGGGSRLLRPARGVFAVTHQELKLPSVWF